MTSSLPRGAWNIYTFEKEIFLLLLLLVQFLQKSCAFLFSARIGAMGFHPWPENMTDRSLASSDIQISPQPTVFQNYQLDLRPLKPA